MLQLRAKTKLLTVPPLSIGTHLYSSVNYGVNGENENAQSSKRKQRGFEPGLTWLRVRHSTAELPRSIWPCHISVFPILNLFSFSLVVFVVLIFTNWCSIQEHVSRVCRKDCAQMFEIRLLWTAETLKADNSISVGTIYTVFLLFACPSRLNCRGHLQRSCVPLLYDQ